MNWEQKLSCNYAIKTDFSCPQPAIKGLENAVIHQSRPERSLSLAVACLSSAKRIGSVKYRRMGAWMIWGESLLKDNLLLKICKSFNGSTFPRTACKKTLLFHQISVKFMTNYQNMNILTESMKILRFCATTYNYRNLSFPRSWYFLNALLFIYLFINVW